jgi:hypothetical protein
MSPSGNSTGMSKKTSIDPLDETNYVTWSFRVKAKLREKLCWDYVQAKPADLPDDASDERK